MENQNNTLILSQEKLEMIFGKLMPYINDDDVTDINCNSRSVWLDSITKGRYEVKGLDIDSDEIERMGYLMSNENNEQFNVAYPILQAELPNMRLQFVHRSVAISGSSVSIRKTPSVSRINAEQVQENEYCTTKGLEFLKAAAEAQLNTVVCGMTGSGKTELVKFLSGYINPWERIITIEDTLELHLVDVYPEKDIVELEVNDIVDYDAAIKSCMRMDPTWVLLSEARSSEIKELLKSISTGAKIMTTLHTDDARDIPKRMLNMFSDNELSNEKVENMIYDYVDVGIHIEKEMHQGSMHRYISQIVVFNYDEDSGRTADLIYDVTPDHIVHYYSIPESTVKKLAKKGISIEWNEQVVGFDGHVYDTGGDADE